MPSQNKQREDFVRLLYAMAAELENKPTRVDFPFNLLVKPVQYSLDALEAFIGDRVVGFEDWIKPKASPLQEKFSLKATAQRSYKVESSSAVLSPDSWKLYVQNWMIGREKVTPPLTCR